MTYAVCDSKSARGTPCRRPLAHTYEHEGNRLDNFQSVSWLLDGGTEDVFLGRERRMLVSSVPTPQPNWVEQRFIDPPSIDEAPWPFADLLDISCPAGPVEPISFAAIEKLIEELAPWPKEIVGGDSEVAKFKSLFPEIVGPVSIPIGHYRGIPIFVDAGVPPGELELRMSDGSKKRITGLYGEKSK